MRHVTLLDSNNFCGGGSSLTSCTDIFDPKIVNHERMAYKEVAVDMSDWLVDLRRLSGSLIQLTAARVSWAKSFPHRSLRNREQPRA